MEQNQRGQWGSKMGFLLAVIGSAVGLGNIWRYPYMLYENGGGAFLVPYFIAIITAGIPLVLLEYGFGHKFRGSAPMSYARANKNLEWLGWIPSLVSFVVLTFYVAILGWATNYLFFSFAQTWGADPNGFFFNEFLKVSSGPFDIGTFQFPIMITVITVWAINWFIGFNGVSSGIERLNKILIPALMVIMAIIVIRGVTLPGATVGLNRLFEPDWSKIADSKVWLDAYGQVFFSLSLALGALITYSSYLPKKTDLNNSALITAFANCGFEFFAAIGIFGILGYMAQAQGVDVSEVASGGIGLAFIVFPQVFTTMGAFGKFFGALFFLSLVVAGLTSSISLLEGFSSAVIDKTGQSRGKVVTVISIFGLMISMVFVTGAGLYILDIMDHFINSFAIVTIGFLEAVLIGWVVGADKIRKHNNEVSIISIGYWWEIIIKFVSPAILGFILINSLINDILNPYENYPVKALLIYGVGTLIVVFVVSFIIDRLPWRKGALEEYAATVSDYEGESEE